MIITDMAKYSSCIYGHNTLLGGGVMGWCYGVVLWGGIRGCC